MFEDSCVPFGAPADSTEVPEWVFTEPWVFTELPAAPPPDSRKHEEQSDSSSSRKRPRKEDQNVKGCVKRIKAVTGESVDRIEFELHSGIYQTYGGFGGVDKKYFVLDLDEAIVKVEQVETHKYLAHSLTFTTSKKRKFEVSGWGGGTPGKECQKHSYKAPKSKQICGLVFEGGNKLTCVCVQTQFKKGSRKHPQRLVKNFMDVLYPPCT